MRDYGAAMLAFVKLAGLSQEKLQFPQRDKFLMLTAEAALNAGWPAVAERCHQLVQASSPMHLIARYSTFSAALMDPEFQVYMRQLARFCSYERAEHLLTELQLAPGLPTANGALSAGDYALLVLRGMDLQRPTATESAG